MESFIISFSKEVVFGNNSLSSFTFSDLIISNNINSQMPKKRSFNVDSLLAPDLNNNEQVDFTNEENENNNNKKRKHSNEQEESDQEEEEAEEEEKLSKKKLKQKSNHRSTILSSSTITTGSSNRHNNPSNNKYLSSDLHQNSPFSKLESNNLDVEKWKQTFSKIMARSYKNNNNNNNNHHYTSNNTASHILGTISPKK